MLSEPDPPGSPGNAVETVPPGTHLGRIEFAVGSDKEPLSMQYKDYYQTLGVERTASQDDIKKAYRKLARKYHPDVSKEADAESRFKEVSEAYEALRDPERRAAYDALGSGHRGGEEFRPPPGWGGFEFRQGAGGEGAAGFGGGGFSDFFENLFTGGAAGGRRQQSWSSRGADQAARIRLPLEAVARGEQREVTLQTPSGPRTLRVKIPRGIEPGQQIRLPGQGGQGLGEGAAGDLYLEVEYEPHRLFQVKGRDIYLNLPLAPWEAALGATIAVPTLGGRVDLRVPAGTQSGQRLRLKGRGLPAQRGAAPGDQYVVAQIHLPPVKDEEDRAMWEALQRRSDFDPRVRWEGNV